MLYESKKRDSKYPAWIDKNRLDNGDILEVVSEPHQMDNKFQPGEKQWVANVKDKEGGIYTAKLTTATMEHFKKAFGGETKDWVGKEAIVMLALTPQGKITMVLRPVTDF